MPDHTTRSWIVSDTLTMVGRSVRHSVRSVEALLIAALLPVLLLLIFVYLFGGAISTRAAYIEYVVPGIVVLCAGYGASLTAVSVATDLDRERGMIDRFRSMDIVSSAVLTGHVVASVGRNVVSTLLVFAVALAIGFRPTAGPLAWVGVAGVVLLFVVAISWLSAAAGVLVRTVEGANAVSFVVMFLPYVSSAFVPPDTLPVGLRQVAEHQPVTPVIETVRALLTGTAVGDSAWLAVAWWAAILLASMVLAAALFRRRTTA